MKTDLIIPQERRRVCRGEVARIRWKRSLCIYKPIGSCDVSWMIGGKNELVKRDYWN
jgi:hypothetical protein